MSVLLVVVGGAEDAEGGEGGEGFSFALKLCDVGLECGQ
jgi:hypothetical protein